jgi:hypothetical protein
MAEEEPIVMNHIARRAFCAGALALVCLAAIADAAPPKPVPRLRVSDDKRFLVYEDGKPFFYLGDTAWELFHRLNREETDLYLDDRAKKGFTVVQAVVLAELAGLVAPNAYGDLPLVGGRLEKPDENYFRHVDYVVEAARKRGLFVGMLPTWGDKWNKKWGEGPEIFTPENAESYGEWLGHRYRDAPIIWILGGDRSPESSRHVEIIRALARGLAKGDGGAHLMTFHPMGGTSSADYFHGEEWLDFDMFQSGHSRPSAPNYELTAKARAMTPAKPILDGEPRYEDHPVDWKPENGWFDAWDVRQAAYWSMLAGACGHTYGDHDIWQMWQPGRKPISSARTPWRLALHHPGSADMGIMRRLFESRAWQTLVPSHDLVEKSYEGADKILAARASDGSFAFVYTPTGSPIAARLAKIGTRGLRASWFDPRTGETREIGKFPSEGAHTFEPPSSGRGNDWLLILEKDNSRG